MHHAEPDTLGGLAYQSLLHYNTVYRSMWITYKGVSCPPRKSYKSENPQNKMR